MTLSEISIRRPVFAWILMFALIFFGMMAFFQMGINENPDVDFPTVTVNYSYEGASPAVVEKDVIEPVESVLVALEGINNLSSVASRGSARITLEFELDRNIDFALQEVQTILGRAQRLIPDNVDPPTITKSNADDDPIMILALSAEGYSTKDIMLLFRDQIRDRFSTVPGVSEVRAFGYHEPMIRVDVSIEKLKSYQLTINDIVESIRREHQELPAGQIIKDDNESTLRVVGEAANIDELKKIVISRRGGSPNYIPLTLAQVANVYEGTENIKRISRVNGKTAMGMAIQKQSGVNAVQVGDAVKKRVEEIKSELPKGVELYVNFDRTHFIRESVGELTFTLFLSAVLTSIVCWLFLGSWSATINIVLAIPFSIVGAFIFMYLFGFTLNTFSLLGLTLAIGIVVDDAIIMLENIVRYGQMGFDKVNAAYKGSREITFAVIATTLALISIFVPIGFMSGIEGKFFFEFAVTISIAIALSSLEALTMTPMRCSQFLEIKTKQTKFRTAFDKVIQSLTDAYTKALNYSLDQRKKIVAASFVFFGLSLFGFQFLETEFAPRQDTGALSLTFLAPDGRSMAYTNEKVKEFEKIAMDHPGIERVFVAVGGFGAGGQGNRGNGMLILKDAKKRTKTQTEIAEELRLATKDIQGIRIVIRDRGGSAFGGRRGSPIDFTINGPDPEMQLAYFEKIKTKMDESGLFDSTRSDDATLLPELQVIPNRTRALERGVEFSEVANTINYSFSGVTAAQLTQGSRRNDIFVQLEEEFRQTREDISPLLVRNNRSEFIPISQVVDFVDAKSPQYIFREDRVRGVRVDSSMLPSVAQGRAIEEVRKIASEVLPKEYFIRFGGSPSEKIKEIGFIIILGLLVSYMVLASQFNSFIDPLVVFLAIPFGLMGSGFALWLGDYTLNVYSAIGIMLTMGIVKKNSILLVEFSNQLRDGGKSMREALLYAGSTRLRPIMMTTLATLAAALPPALAFGPGAETRIPMALTVIGGVTVSTFFTLLVVPCVISLISPERKKILIESD